MAVSARTVLARGLAWTAVAAALFGLHAWLTPRGLGWIAWALAITLASGALLEVGLRAHRRRREGAAQARWRAAVTDAALRPAVLRELRAGIDRARRLGARTRVRHARLAVALAELHLADGKSSEAARVLAAVPLDTLAPAQAVAIRLARAQAYLHGAELDEVRAVLTALPQEVGDAALDASLALLRATLALEEGGREEAAAVARDLAARAAPYDELWDEAKALEAMATSDPSVLDALRPEGRARLRALGPPVVRRWLGATDG